MASLRRHLSPFRWGQQPEYCQECPRQEVGNLNELEETLVFVLICPTYLTGEVLYPNGGRDLH